MGGAFDHIFGQGAAIDAIRRAWTTGRLPHGMIFAGPVGVGKATTARALARLFLCEKPAGDAPCGQCPSCKAFDHEAHPDYHVVTKELIRYHDKGGKSKGISLSIEVIRGEVVEPAGLKAAMGQGKVFVIEQAELMMTQAQNALLKTLEEPPGRALIVLLTSQPFGLLATIRSRCRIVNFGQLPRARVEQELVRRGHDQQTAAEAARLAEGSLGLALRWIEDGVIAAAGELIAQMQRLRNAEPAGDLPGWLKKAAEAYADSQLARDPLSSRDQAQREGLALYLQLAGQVFQQVLRTADDSGELDRACAAIEALLGAEALLDANVNVNLCLLQLAVTLQRVCRPTAA